MYEKMKNGWAGTIATVGFGLAAVVSAVNRTGTTEVGVRTKKFDIPGISAAEVIQEPYQPGSTYLFLPIVNDWHKFDTKLVNIEMREERTEKDSGSLAFKTRDGNDIDLDIIFSYRVDPNKAAHIVEYVAQSDGELRDKIVTTVARSKTRDFFGELSTEEFYTANSRNIAAEKAKVGLQGILDDYGVIVEKVGTKDYRWGNREYSDAIKDKVDAEAQERVVRSEINAIEQKNAEMLATAEGEVNKMTREADGKYARAVIDADADFARKSQRAEAILTEGQNTAEAITKKREAMMSAGGETLVQMEFAKSLEGKPFYMLPIGSSGLDITKTDMNSLFEQLGLFSAAGEDIIRDDK